jgi:choline-sulfatase
MNTALEGMRMNVLMLLVDQLAAQWLPAYGHRTVRAPRLEALAREGVVFDSAYCASPLCAPSRSAFITGRLPSRIGVFDNAAELPASIPTLAHRLRARGYHTCLAGKMHFVGPDQLHGFEERLTTDIYPADLDWTPDWRRPPSDRLPWYHTMESVLNPGVCAASMQMDFDEEVAFHGARALLDHARQRREQPLFLVVSFTHPHDPWEIAPRYWDLYDPEEIPPPAVPAIPLSEADPHSRRLREMCAIDEACLSERQLRRARHAYYASISYVDERIGEVLDALRLSGLERDTLIVFTADHGEMLGERGLWYKMSFFEPSARVPLIFRVPGDPGGRRVASPVSLLDLPPTLLELTGGSDGHGPSADLDGVSLAPLLAGGDGGGQRAVFAEYLAEGVTAPALMVRKGRHKLILCDGDPDQLYDLAADPRELVNLAAEARGAEVAQRLRAEAQARWDAAALAAQVLASQRDRLLVARALREGAYAPWDYQPRVDASMQYVRNRADMYELQRQARLDADGHARDALGVPARSASGTRAREEGSA